MKSRVKETHENGHLSIMSGCDIRTCVENSTLEPGFLLYFKTLVSLKKLNTKGSIEIKTENENYFKNFSLIRSTPKIFRSDF